MIKLGIAVVYLVKKENEKLLDIHLEQIKKHTKVPYKIYACVNRLLPAFKEKLKKNPNIVICDCPDTDLRVSEEHSFYLDFLAGKAVEDGATHIAMMHVDSFPVSPDWVDYSLEKLKTHSFAAVMRKENMDEKPNPIFIFFTAAFLNIYKPSLHLLAGERVSDDYKEYKRCVRHFVDSGVGYGFLAFQKGLSWYPLLKSNIREDHYLIGSIYDNIIFHLGAAARDDKKFFADRFIVDKKEAYDLLNIFQKIAGRFNSSLLEKNIKSRLSRNNEKIFLKAKQKLFKDPEAYFRELRIKDA